MVAALPAVWPVVFVDQFVAVNREHELTKTGTLRRRRYREAIEIVRKHYGSGPLKWWIFQPYTAQINDTLPMCDGGRPALIYGVRIKIRCDHKSAHD